MNRVFVQPYFVPTIDSDNRSGDALLAARSLPEGDARLVEDLFAMQNITRDQLEYTVYRYLFEDHPELEGVSSALGVFTYFPYTAGEYFAIYLFIIEKPLPLVVDPKKVLPVY